MSNEFVIHRVVCATPPGQEEERDLVLADLAAFSERVSMPEGILFAPASFPTGFNATMLQAAVKNNIRNAVFFLGFFGEDPTEPVFKRFVEYALECADDPALPLRRVTLFFKDSEDVDPEMIALRQRWVGQCDVLLYRRLANLAPQIEDLLAGWFAAVHEEKAACNP